MFSVQREVLDFNYQRNGHTQSAPIELYYPSGSLVEGVTMPMAILGLGNEGLYARRFTRLLSELEMPGVSVVLHFPDKESIDQVCMGGLNFTASALNRRMGVPEDTPMNTLSHSQGGGILLASARETPQLVGKRHSVVAPVGLNSRALGSEGRERSHEFWRRYMFCNMTQPGMVTDLRHWRAGIGAAGRLLNDTLVSKVKNGYNLLPSKIDYAIGNKLSDASVEGIKHLAAFAHPLLIVGKNDPIFRVDEISATLYENAGQDPIELAVVSGAHEPLIGKKGYPQLVAAVAFMKLALPTAA